MGEEIAGGQESGRNNEDEQYRRATGCDDQRELAGLPRGLDTLGQRDAILIEELADEIANAVHGQLAAVGEHDRQRALRISSPLEHDGFLQLAQLLLGEALDLTQQLLLLGIVGRQAPQLLQLARNVGARVVVGLEVGLAVGQQVAALAGFGVFHARQEAIDPLHDSQGMGGVGGAFRLVVQGAIAEECDQEHGDDGSDEACERPGGECRTEPVGPTGVRGRGSFAHDLVVSGQFDSISLVSASASSVVFASAARLRVAVRLDAPLA